MDCDQHYFLWYCAHDRNYTFQFWNGRPLYELCNRFVCIDVTDRIHPIYLGDDTNAKTDTFLGVPFSRNSCISVGDMASVADDHFLGTVHFVPIQRIKIAGFHDWLVIRAEFGSFLKALPSSADASISTGRQNFMWQPRGVFKCASMLPNNCGRRNHTAR